MALTVLGVIPARLASTRLPRKVLRDLVGRPLLAWVYEAARDGRTVVDVWADARSKSRLGSSLRSIAAFVVIGHAVYLSVFAPHLATKLLHLQTVGPTEPLFEGVPNQPL